MRHLPALGMADLASRGIYYGAALAEAAAYRGQPLYVVGGAHSAGQAAMFFSRYASQVTMLVRSRSLSKSMCDYLIRQIEKRPNIAVLMRTSVVEAHGKSNWR